VRCEEARALAPEFALNLADGEDRAEVLRHLASCDDCRRLVEQLSEVADELLTIAPVEEPPIGFESRVTERIGVRSPRRPRPVRKLLLRVAPALAAAAVTAVALIAVYDDDRELASRYRDALERAGGQYFQAAPLVAPTGEEAGVAFGYEGTPSWVLVTVDPAHRDQVARAELITEDGRSTRLESFRLDRETGSWGGVIPLELREVDSIRLLGTRPGEEIEATIPRAGSDELP
jgi:hypothetical protein